LAADSVMCDSRETQIVTYGIGISQVQS